MLQKNLHDAKLTIERMMETNSQNKTAAKNQLEEVNAVKTSLEVVNKELKATLVKKEEENSILQEVLDTAKRDTQHMMESNSEKEERGRTQLYATIALMESLKARNKEIEEHLSRKADEVQQLQKDTDEKFAKQKDEFNQEKNEIEEKVLSKLKDEKESMDNTIESLQEELANASNKYLI